MRFQNLGGIIAAVLLLVASFVSAYHSLEYPTREDHGPLSVDLPVQDLGRLRQGVHTPCYFQLTNTSSQTVYISRIIGSCSCTSHAIAETKLAPGAATKLRLEHDSGSSRGAASASISVLYFLEGEDQLRKLVVAVRAEVDPDM